MDGENENEDQSHDDRSKTKAQECADLEKVTDYAEEKEISINATNLETINLIEAQRNKETQAREEELAKVKITREDVDLLIKELEITRQQAELALRQSSGDIVQAFVRLLS